MMSETNINAKRIMIYGNNNLTNLNKRRCVKTTVYSGQSRNILRIQPLKSLCLDVLSEIMVNKMESLANISRKHFDAIKRLLENCNAIQLKEFEKYNPKLMCLTDGLWHQLCDNTLHLNNRDCKTENESWRNYYHRLTKDIQRRITSRATVIRIDAQNIRERKKKILIDAIPCADEKTNPRDKLISVKNNRSKVAPLMQKCLTIRKNFSKR